jgi:predicted nucleic-acid-binding protein
LIALDTNLLVRLLVNDDQRQAAKVEAWLAKQSSPARPAWVDHVVLCELVWVLERSYSYQREEVNVCITALLEHKSLKVESPELVRQALALHASQSADFSDYLLAARAQAAGYSPVLTFDKKAAKSGAHELLR